MTQSRALSLSFLTALIASLLMAAPAAAQQTECQPDDLLCAEIRIGPAQGGIRIGPGGRQQPPPPPPPPPQPPVVIVQPEPPPPPPVVVVQPRRPPPPPVRTYVAPRPRPQPQYVVVEETPRDRFPYSSTALHLHLDGLFGENLGMAGGGAAFRIRPNPWFAVDIGGSVYGGVDYNGLDRVELPLTVDARVYLNPQHRFQFYLLLGVGASYSHAEGYNVNTLRGESRDYFHLGGQAGVGIEWRISRVFALSLDARGFLRHRVDDNPQPEFTEPNGAGGWQSTDFSGGFTGRAGMTFYFGR